MLTALIYIGSALGIIFLGIIALMIIVPLYIVIRLGIQGSSYKKRWRK